MTRATRQEMDAFLRKNYPVDENWAGRGFTGPPAAPDPGKRRQELRKMLRDSGPLTLADFERAFPVTDRRTLIAELAAMRDDGEVRFEGPRYVLADPDQEVWNFLDGTGKA